MRNIKDIREEIDIMIENMEWYTKHKWKGLSEEELTEKLPKKDFICSLLKFFEHISYPFLIYTITLSFRFRSNYLLHCDL